MHLAVGPNVNDDIYTSQIFHFSCDAVDDELFFKGKVGLFDCLLIRDCVVLMSSSISLRKLVLSTIESGSDAQATLLSRS